MSARMAAKHNKCEEAFTRDAPKLIWAIRIFTWSRSESWQSIWFSSYSCSNEKGYTNFFVIYYYYYIAFWRGWKNSGSLQLFLKYFKIIADRTHVRLCELMIICALHTRVQNFERRSLWLDPDYAECGPWWDGLTVSISITSENLYTIQFHSLSLDYISEKFFSTRSVCYTARHQPY